MKPRDLVRSRAWPVLLAFFPGLLLLGYVARFGVDVPFWDEWDFVLYLVKLADHRLRFSELFLQHNEHRIFVPRALMLALDQLTGVDTRASMFASTLFVLGAGGVLLAFHRRLRGDWSLRSLWEFVPIAWLMFTMRQVENLIWGWQLSITGCLFFFLLTLYLIETRTPLRLGLACLTGFAASYSFASGLLVWPLGVLALALPRDGNRQLRYLVAWVAAGLATLTFYFVGYVSPSHTGSLLLALRHPLRAIWFFLEGLGSPLAVSGPFAVGIALLLLACLAVLLIGRPLQRLSHGHLMAAFGLCSAGLLAAGRVGYGSARALESRYTTFMVLAAIGIYELARQDWSRRRSARIAGLALVAVVAAAQPHVAAWALSYGRNESNERHRMAAMLPYLQAAPDEVVARYHPIPELVRGGAKFLEANRLSVFRQPLGPLPGSTLFWVDTMNGLAPARGDEIGRSIRERGELVLTGWAVDAARRRRAEGVLVAVDGQQLVMADAMLARPDVAEHLRTPAYTLSGFACRIPAQALPPGKHELQLRIVTRGGRYYEAGPIGPVTVP